MERALARAERLNAIERLLYRSFQGLSVPEIAAHFGVHRSTVYRDVESLSAMEVPIWEKDGRFGLNRERYLITVRLDMHEALALYLAARLLSAHSDKHNPHAVSAMKSLAAMSPQNRLMEPEEIATLTLHLASREAHGINGQAINVDGGSVMV